MTERLQVRVAVEDDGSAIGEAHAEAWLAAYTHIFERDFLDGAAESRRVRWPHAIGGQLVLPNLLLVGIVGDQVVAFAHSRPTTVPSTAEITGFYSHPAAWGTGIAAALMTRANDELAKRFGTVIVWAARDAARARRFYEKVGFQPTGSARDESLTNWITGEEARCVAVEYTTSLAR